MMNEEQKKALGFAICLMEVNYMQTQEGTSLRNIVESYTNTLRAMFSASMDSDPVRKDEPQQKGEPNLELHYAVDHNGDYTAGIPAFSEDVHVSIDGWTGTDRDLMELDQELQSVFSEWYDGASVQAMKIVRRWEEKTYRCRYMNEEFEG